MFGIWLIDYSLTFIMLNFFSGFEEANPIMAVLYNAGWHGWVISPFIGLSLLYILGIFIDNRYERGLRNLSEHPKKRESFKKYFYPTIIGVFILLEGYVVIHNLNLILSVL